MKRQTKKFLVLLLSFALAFTMLAMPVYADGDATEGFDNSTTLSDGTYTIDTDHYMFTGGTGKAKLICTQVTVADGKAMGTFTSTSANMTHVHIGHTDTDTDDPRYYDPATDTLGQDTYAIVNKTVDMPVKINEGVDIAGRTTAMSVPHWIQYNYTITIDENQGPSQEDPADYTAVDAALSTVPQDLSIYTDETAQAVTDAVNAVVRGKTAAEQAEVDAMAQAILDAVAALVEKTTEPPQDELTDGTYTARNIQTDVTTDASGMIMVTAAKVVIKDGQATAAVTMKGTGADRFYVSDTATKDNIISEAVAAEQQELSGQEGGLLGGLVLEGSSAYTFWPVPITLGEPKVYAARSADHFRKQDRTPDKYYYVHDFQINKEDLVKVSDSTELMTPQQEAQRFLDQYYLDGKITSDHTGAVTGRGANATIKYYDGATKVSSVKLKRLTGNSSFRVGWFIDRSILNTTYFTSSNLKKIRYPEGKSGTVTFQPKDTYRDNGMTVTATLKVFSADANYDQYDADEVYYDQEPLATQEFNITLEEKPIIDFDITVVASDVKTKETIEGVTIKVVDEETSEEVTPKSEGVYTLNSLKKYTISVSKEGYLVQGGGTEAVKTSYSPSKEETVKLELIKAEDATHKITFHVVDQLGDEVTDPVITVTRNEEAVAPEEDGTYVLYDGIAYNYTVKAEGYEDYNYGWIKPTEDTTQEVKINKYLSEYHISFRVYDDKTSEVIEDAEKVVTIGDVVVEPNEDGSYTIPADTEFKCVATKEGYQDGTYENKPYGFEPEYSVSISMKLTYKNQLIAEIEKAEAQRGAIVEEEMPLGYPAGTKAALDEEITAAKNLLDNEEATEEEFQNELKKLQDAEKKATNAQYPDEAKVYVRLNRQAGEAAELMVLDVKGDASTSHNYFKRAANKKYVTILDVVVAVHEKIFGEEFNNDPTSKLEYDDWMDCITTIFGEKTNKTSYALNNVHVDHMACQKTHVHTGDVVTIKIDKGYKDTYLYFEDLEKDAFTSEFTETLYAGAKVSASDTGVKANGFEVTLTGEDGSELKAVSDEEGMITFNFEHDGTYTVKSATKEGMDAITVPYLKLNVRFEELAEAKVKAEEEISTFVDPEDYREEQQNEINAIIDEAKANIEAAETIEEAESILNSAKESISEVKTDKELLIEEKEAAEAKAAESEKQAKEAKEAQEKAEAAKAEAEKAAQTAKEAEEKANQKAEEYKTAAEKAEAAKAEAEKAAKEAKAEADKATQENSNNAKALEEAIAAQKKAEDAQKAAEDELSKMKAAKEAAEEEAETARKEAEAAKADAAKARKIAAVKTTTIKLKVKKTKKAMKLSWKKSGKVKIESYQIFRSLRKSKFTKKAYAKAKGTAKIFRDKKKLKKGKTYYYKVRGVVTVDGKKYYTQWSNVAGKKR